MTSMLFLHLSRCAPHLSDAERKELSDRVASDYFAHNDSSN
jgi:hypothetical protein